MFFYLKKRRDLNEKKDIEVIKLQEKLSALINENGSKQEIEELTLKIENIIMNQEKNIDIENIIKEIAPISIYALQQYKMPLEYKDEDLFKLRKKPHSQNTFEVAKKMCEKLAKKVIIR